MVFPTENKYGVAHFIFHSDNEIVSRKVYARLPFLLIIIT